MGRTSGSVPEIKPGKIEGAIWKETLEATGVTVGKDKTGSDALGFRKMRREE